MPPNVAAELERDIARLRLVIGQIKQLEEASRQRLEEQPERGPHAMVRLLARVVGIGIETADMLVNEVMSRPMRDRRAVARYAGLTGAPWDDPTRLALSAVSKEQRTGPVVPGPHGRSPRRHAQNNDRRPGAQAAHRTLAICHHWRAIGRCHPASGKLTNLWRIISLPARRSLLASTTGTAGRRSLAVYLFPRQIAVNIAVRS